MPHLIDEAEEYELFGYPPTTQQDCNFLEDIFMSSGRKIDTLLDVACGTGRHAVEMAQRGYTVTGVDHSDAMLQAAARRAETAGAMATWKQADIRALDFTAAFDAAYVFFNTLSLLTTNEDILSFFNGVYCALRANGLLIFEVGNLWAYIAGGHFANGVFESEEEHAGLKRQLQLEMVIGPYDNVYQMRQIKHYWRDDIPLGEEAETYTLRAFSWNELRLILQLTGFMPIQLFGMTKLEAVLDTPDMIDVLPDAYRSYVVLALKQKAQNDETDTVRQRKRKGRVPKARPS